MFGVEEGRRKSNVLSERNMFMIKAIYSMTHQRDANISHVNGPLGTYSPQSRRISSVSPDTECERDVHHRFHFFGIRTFVFCASRELNESSRGSSMSIGGVPWCRVPNESRDAEPDDKLRDESSAKVEVPLSRLERCCPPPTRTKSSAVGGGETAPSALSAERDFPRGSVDFP
jgi:hypothetical protein